MLIPMNYFRPPLKRSLHQLGNFFRGPSLGLNENTVHIHGTKHAYCGKEAVHRRYSNLLHSREEQLPESKVEHPVTHHGQRNSSPCTAKSAHQPCAKDTCMLEDHALDTGNCGEPTSNGHWQELRSQQAWNRPRAQGKRQHIQQGEYQRHWADYSRQRWNSESCSHHQHRCALANEADREQLPACTHSLATRVSGTIDTP